MQILTVAPVTRGAIQESLTYFSKEDIEVGMVIMVPIRTREVPAIVLDARPASGIKSTLKSSEYTLRKINKAKPRRVWTQAFVKAVALTAESSAQKFGELLLTLTPKTILSAYQEEVLSFPEITPSNHRIKKIALQRDTASRLDYYQNFIQESFAKNESVFICLPTEEGVERVARILKKNIEDFTFAFHGKLTQKRTIERWQKVTTEQHPVLVVGTPQFLSLPRHFETIILDEEHSASWKTIVRPLFDLRTFVEQFAQVNKSSLVIGASILRAETHARILAGEISLHELSKQTARNNPKTFLIDPRAEEKERRERSGQKGMILLTKELTTLIETASTNSEHTLLLSARKGLAPITSCGDCGTVITCPECDTPLTIHQKETRGTKANIYTCHGCGFTRAPEDDVHETCPSCSGWKLQGVGIGIELIEKEIATRFPSVPCFALDGNHAKTKAQAKKIIAEFKATPGSILIATPMAVSLLEHVPHTAIISIDSLFAIPNIRMSERIFALILTLREKTTGTLLIQTRTDDTEILTQALAGDIAPFIENELALRKAFSYPPYGTIIKITIRGKREDVTTEIERLKTFLEEYAPIASNTLAREPKNIFRTHLLLKLNPENWPNRQLLGKLMALPRHFTIEVNPENIL